MPILSFDSSNPLVDGRQSERAMSIRKGVVSYFEELGVPMLAEFTLKSGRRADLIGIDTKGNITIIEIKSSIEDFRADNKWHEYADFCDRFYFATLPDVPGEIFPDSEGLIIADSYGCEIIREASIDKLPPATRKSVTLRYARASTQRLSRVLEYCEKSGTPIPDQLDQLND